MAKGAIGELPFPLKVIDSDDLISEEKLSELLEESGQVSLCLRTAEGHPHRGGYFFHFSYVDDVFRIHDIVGKVLASVGLDFLSRFVNHVSGRLFDPEILGFCQQTINFKEDEMSASEDS